MIVRELISRFGFDVDQQGFNRANDGFKKLKGVAVAAVAALAAATIVAQKKLLDLGSDANETANVVESSFGSMVPAVRDWAKEVARAAGRSEFTLLEFAGSAGAMLKPMLGSAEAAAEMSTQVAELAVDLGSFFNVNDPDALQALKSGLIGSSEPMQKFGVVMNVAALDAFALQEGLGKTTAKMTDAEKVALRFKFIMEKTRDAQGDAAKTAKGYANASKALAAGIKDVATRIGKMLIPSAEESLAGLIEIVRAVDDWVVANKVWLQQNITAKFQQFGSLLKTIYLWNKMLVGAVIDLWRSFTPLTQWIFKATMALVLFLIALTSPITIMLLLAALITIIVDDFRHWWEDTGKVNTAFGRLDKAMGGVLGQVRDLIKTNSGLDLWAKLWGLAAENVGKLVEELTGIDFDILEKWFEQGGIIGSVIDSIKSGLTPQGPMENAAGARASASSQAAFAGAEWQGGGGAPTANVTVNVQAPLDQSPENLGNVAAKAAAGAVNDIIRQASRHVSVATP